MKIVLRDYIQSLKEDKELDSLLYELLFSMGIKPISKPKKGVRQDGVDIPAVGIDATDGQKKLFLFTIKRGNMDRSNWDTGMQSVRTSLNDIKDKYLRNISPANQKLPCKIVVCCNGILDQAVEGNWSGYLTDNTEIGKREYEFWDISTLVYHCEEYLLSSTMFNEDIQLLLRKTLVTIDLEEPNYGFYFELCEKMFDKSSKVDKDAVAIKKLRGINLCQNIIFRWSEERGNIKHALYLSDRTTLLTYDYLRHNDKLEKRPLLLEFSKILKTNLDFGYIYYGKIQNHCYVKDSFAKYGHPLVHEEYQITVIEQLGMLSMIALKAMFVASALNDGGTFYEEHKLAFIEISDGIANLISNNAGSSYLVFDEQIIDISLTLMVFFYSDNSTSIENYINNLIDNLVLSFQIKGRFPMFVTNYENIGQVESSPGVTKEKSTILLTCLIEWSLVANNERLYRKLTGIANQFFKDINFQLWYPTKDTEEKMFSENAMRSTGKTQSGIKFPKRLKEYTFIVADEFRWWCEDNNFQHAKKGLSILSLLSSYHYRSYIFPTFWRELIPMVKCYATERPDPHQIT